MTNTNHTIKLLKEALDNGVSLFLQEGNLKLRRNKNIDIDAAFLVKLKNHKEEIEAFLKNQKNNNAGKHKFGKIKVNQFDRTDKRPLSNAQERLWFVDQLNGSTNYHQHAVLNIKGNLDVVLLESIFNTIIDRHEILRGTIVEEGDTFFQNILPENQWNIEFEKLGGEINSEKRSALIDAFIKRPFDLSSDYTLRVKVLQQAENNFTLIIVFHHIASDAWSESLIIKEFVELYNANKEGRNPNLPEINIQFSDYAQWEKENLNESLLSEKLNYWEDKLSGIEPLNLSFNYGDNSRQEMKGMSHSFLIDAEISKRIKKLAQKEGVTTFMLLQTIYKVLLYKYTNQTDICIGTSFANRNQPELEYLVGNFVDLLVLRDDLSEDPTFSELLAEVKKTTLDAFSNKEVPFNQVMDLVQENDTKGRNDLIRTLFVLNNTPKPDAIELKDLEVSLEANDIVMTHFDLCFYVSESPLGLNFKINYFNNLFNSNTIKRLRSHFLNLLREVLDDPNRKIGALNMLSKVEKSILLFNNNSEVSYPEDKNIIDIFEQNVISHSDKVALVFGEEKWTYTTLNEHANRIAKHLIQKQNVNANDLIGVSVSNPLFHIVATLGILKAGATYVPIDVEYPIERKAFIIEDTQLKVLLNENTDELEGLSLGVPTVSIQNLLSEPCSEEDKQNLYRLIEPQQLAYVVYTSGTTGRPKGVMITHQNILDYLYGLDSKINIQSCKSFGFMSSLYADLGNTSIFGALFTGATLYLFDKTQSTNPTYLHEFFNHNQIDCIKIVPSHFRALEVNGKDLLPEKMIIFGGEALSNDLVKKITNENKELKIVNHYGPTETTIGKLLHIVDPNKDYETIPIGKPFSNTEIYVVNKDLSLCPIGVAGELLIGGDGLTPGYLNRNELTQEKLIENPFCKDCYSKLYRTGDLVRRTPKGDIEFLGRIDDQVKIRGNRVEIGAVEACLEKFNAVKQAVVTPISKNNSLQLAAYLVPEGIFDQKEIKEYVSNYLPDYMVPSFFIEMETIPITKNGKINKRALPAPDSGNASLPFETITPRNRTEEQLVKIWKDLLDLEQVGLKDDFFDVGGHSLIAIRVVLAIRKQLEIDLEIKDLFENATIESLAAFINATEENENIIPIIQAGKRSDKIPLSFSQERLWIIDQLEGSTNYHIDYVQQFDTNLHVQALENAFLAVVNRHEVLRTIIEQDNGIPYQKIMNKGQWALEYVELQDGQEQEYLSNQIFEFTNRAFDFSKDHMLRAKLFKLEDETYVLNLVVHHIASDLWSQKIMFQEVLEFYHSTLENRAPQLNVLEIQYADYAVWQRDHFSNETLAKQLTYWKKQLANIEPLNLPTTYKRTIKPKKQGSVLKFSIDKNKLTDLQSLSKAHGVTMYILCLSVFKLLLQKYTGQNDICVGSPVANRTTSEVEHLIGFFLNALALRTDLKGNPSFIDLLNKVKQTVLKGQENQSISFEKVLENLNTEKEPGRSQVFQVWFDLHDQLNLFGENNLQFGESNLIAQSESIKSDYVPVKFDIDFIAHVNKEGIDFNLIYPIELFDEATIHRMRDHFLQILNEVIINPNANIDSVNILTEEEQIVLLQKFNSNRVDYPIDKTVLDIFEQQVKSSPENIAVIYKNKVLNFKELDHLSNKLARHLVESYKVKTDDLIGIMMERSEWTIVSILAILKAGGAYVPIALNNPTDRKRFIIEDTGLKLLMIDSSSILDVMEFGIDVFSVDIQLEDLPETNIPVNNAKPSSLSYVIYTSGTSGKPKGVLVEHRGLLNLSLAQIKGFNLNESSRTLQFSSLGFDASCSEIFTSLLSGGRLVIPQSSDILDPERLRKLIIDHEIDIATLPPSYQASIKEELKNLKTLVSAGEMLNTSIIEEVQKAGVRVINAYGPTENTVCISMTDQSINLDETVTIGKPIDNVKVYILNAQNNIMPIGVPGEICVGGVQVARGYLNRPDLNREKFIEDCFSTDEKGKIYKTGDLGRWLADGSIEYLGRVDDQVKIRGFRMELGEINTVLNNGPNLAQTHVLVKSDDKGLKKLVAYIVPKDQYKKEEVLVYLRSKLPDYMIPTTLISIDKMPLTSNGKVNVKALPESDDTMLADENYIGPRSVREKVLVEIWQDLLNISQIGIYDNFFELGGDSIICIQLVSRAREKNITLQPKDVFEYPVIAELAEKVAKNNCNMEAQQERLSGKVGLAPIQKWFFSQEFNDQSYYNQAYLFKLKKNLSFEYLNQTIEALMNQHDALRFRYFIEDGKWIQEYSDQYAKLEVIDLVDIEKHEVEGVITEKCKALQQSLDIEKGNLFKAILFKTPEEEEKNRLFILVHHLVVDGVSWRILLHQFQSAMQQLEEGKAIDFFGKTTSYQQWISSLSEFANSDTIKLQRTFWKKQIEKFKELPVDFKKKDQTIRRGSEKQLSCSLSRELTTELLTKVNHRYQTEVNDILLSALSKTISNWTGESDLLVGLEGHGRISLRKEIDVSNTIGWFTNVYPVLLNQPKDNALGKLILNTKEQLRRIPDEGLGFSLLKYMNPFQNAEDPLVNSKWDITFNYLGQADNVLNTDSLLEVSAEDKGKDISDAFPINGKLTVNGIVHKGTLNFRWTYSENQYFEKTIQNIADKFLDNLETLINHCLQKVEKEITPTVFGLDGKVSHEEFMDLFDIQEEEVMRF